MPMPTMQRYWLFAGDMYYTQGGWYDVRGSYATVAEAVAAGQALLAPEAAHPLHWFQVVDGLYGGLVEQGERTPAFSGH